MDFSSGLGFFQLLLVALIPGAIAMFMLPFTISFLQHNLNERGRQRD